MENYINVIAGRPGAGKTIWACNEAASLASDPNNTVVYIGHMKEFERIVRKAGADKKNLFFARLSNAGEAIGRAIDLANTYSGVFNGMTLDTDQDDCKMVFLFYDQCRYDLFNGRRDILEAAAKAGVKVYMLCQVFDQVDKGDAGWSKLNCNCYVISKSRAPREATEKEIDVKYRGKPKITGG